MSRLRMLQVWMATFSEVGDCRPVGGGMAAPGRMAKASCEPSTKVN
jgi:hypothetical protein